MRMSGLAAQCFHRITALDLCTGVTDPVSEDSLAAPLCTALLLKLSDPQPQSLELSKKVK